VKEKVIEGYYRLGLGYSCWPPWLTSRRYPTAFSTIIAKLVVEDVKEKAPELTMEQIHRLTCGIIDLSATDLTGEQGLTRKVLKVRLRIQVEAELVDNEKTEVVRCKTTTEVKSE